MIKFVVLTLFKDMFDTFANTSIIKRAITKNEMKIDIIDIRDFADNRNRKVDDTPYGGGSGMVISAVPIAKSIDYAIENFCKSSKYEIIYMSPRGEVLNYPLCNKYAERVNKGENIVYILLCGHYEGIDERVIEEYSIKEISIGDYVLTGGELPAMVFMDSLARLVHGVISEDSLSNESHTNNLLEYPQYTRPEIFRGRKVPEILLSGNHEKIDEYRLEESLRITKNNRPDLLLKIQKEKN